MTEDELILASVLNHKRLDLITEDVVLDVEQKKRYDLMSQRRTAREPLQYILGKWSFTNFDVNVDPRVLIPRPETEGMVDFAKQQLRLNANQDDSLRICDLGTGSGNIAIYFAKQFQNAVIDTVDVSADAVCVARENARENQVDARITFHCQDMQDFLLQQIEACQQYDLIISNPPYIRSHDLSALPAEVRWEPSLALDGGEDGLKFYRKIFQFVPPLLRPNGMCICEIGYDQAEDVSEIARMAFTVQQPEVGQDLAGRDRFVWVSQQ